MFANDLNVEPEIISLSPKQERYPGMTYHESDEESKTITKTVTEKKTKPVLKPRTPIWVASVDGTPSFYGKTFEEIEERARDYFRTNFMNINPYVTYHIEESTLELCLTSITNLFIIQYDKTECVITFDKVY